MNFIKEWSGAVALVAIVLLLGFSHAPSFGAASGPSHFQMESFLQGVSGGQRDQFSISNTGALTTSATATFGGAVTFDAGTTQSYTNSTSTVATSQTLAAADIANYSAVLFTPNMAATTLTFPASSTLSTFIPVAGDMATQCWYNATSTAGVKITFAAGTGIDLEVASSTANQTQGATGTNLSVGPGNSACFRFIRKPATASTFDIVAQLTSYTDGD